MKKSISISLILLCIFVSAKAGTYKLNGNTFLITNMKSAYKKANLAQWGTCGRCMGTYENKVAADQLWVLKKSNYYTDADWYYITNAKYEGYRIGKWGWGDRQVGITNGQYYDNQLWKFEKTNSDNVYIIKNKKYCNSGGCSKFAKWGKGNGDWGTYNYNGGDDLHWKLTPRFTAVAGEDVIFKVCNGGSTPIKREITYTKGLTLTSTNSVVTKVGFKAALVYASGAAVGSASFSTDITTSASNTSTKKMSKTVKTYYTVPAKVNYKVTQKTVKFIPAPGLKDGVKLHSSKIRVKQSAANNC